MKRALVQCQTWYELGREEDAWFCRLPRATSRPDALPASPSTYTSKRTILGFWLYLIQGSHQPKLISNRGAKSYDARATTKPECRSGQRNLLREATAAATSSTPTLTNKHERTYTDRSLCARTIPPIGERFFPNKPTDETDPETRAHILIECPRITKDRIASQVPSSFNSLLPTRPPLCFQPENPPERNTYKKNLSLPFWPWDPRYDPMD